MTQQQLRQGTGQGRYDVRATAPMTGVLVVAALVAVLVAGPVSTAPVRSDGVGVAVLLLLLGLLLLLVVLPVAVGSHRRARHELDVTRSDATEQRAVVGEMSDQLWRQAERDLIAREVHDVIGHRLSLLSVHAGGLELAGRHDPQLVESARYVRENAQQAMDDLRSLLRVLREPSSGRAGPWSDHTRTSLADLARVVEETTETGGSVASSVFLTEAETADPVLAHAVYRVVQELLTNARKHAPGAVVRLRVTGGPVDGVTVEASNVVTAGRVDGDDGTAGGGTGLRGVRERVELLGGTMDLPAQDGRFTVRVQLPWRGRTA